MGSESKALSAISSPVRMLSRRAGSSGASAAFPGLIRSYGEPDKPSGLVNHRHELGGKPASTTADSLSIS